MERNFWKAVDAHTAVPIPEGSEPRPSISCVSSTSAWTEVCTTNVEFGVPCMCESAHRCSIGGLHGCDVCHVCDRRRPNGVIFNEVKARFNDLESQYSFTCPTHDHSKEEGELIRKIDGVATAVQGAFNEVKVEMEGGLNEVKVGMKAGFTEVEGVFTSVKGEMKEGFNERCVEGSWEEEMLSKLRDVGKKDMTLQFLCPVDMTKVPCGCGGEGCRFKETQSWVKKISPALQVAVVTAKVALKATTGLNVDISDFLKDVKDGLVEELLVDRTLDEEALLGAILGDDTIDADLQRDTRASYEALKKFMDKEQIERVKNARDGDCYIDFRDEMKRVPDGRGGMVWVRNENVQKWLDSRSIAAPTR